jgi:hypothetical protein
MLNVRALRQAQDHFAEQSTGKWCYGRAFCQCSEILLRLRCDGAIAIPEFWGILGNSLAGFPASKFYSDFQYIGTFMETPQGQEAISFFGADKQAEAELPDIL